MYMCVYIYTTYCKARPLYCPLSNLHPGMCGWHSFQVHCISLSEQSVGQSASQSLRRFVFQFRSRKIYCMSMLIALFGAKICSCHACLMGAPVLFSWRHSWHNPKGSQLWKIQCWCEKKNWYKKNGHDCSGIISLAADGTCAVKLT